MATPSDWFGFSTRRITPLLNTQTPDMASQNEFCYIYIKSDREVYFCKGSRAIALVFGYEFMREFVCELSVFIAMRRWLSFFTFKTKKKKRFWI